MSYGKVTIDPGTPQERDLQIIEYVHTSYPGNRIVRVDKIEDSTYTITEENIFGQKSIRLSEEGLIAIYAGIQMYLGVKGLDVVAMLGELLNGEDIKYECSNNLKPIE